MILGNLGQQSHISAEASITCNRRRAMTMLPGGKRTCNLFMNGVKFLLQKMSHIFCLMHMYYFFSLAKPVILAHLFTQKLEAAVETRGFAP
jgi:hypothetical protein